MSEGDKRRNLRDALDELDRYFEGFERDMQEFVRGAVDRGFKMGNPYVAGFSMKVGPGGKPSIQFFGDSPLAAGGFRSPLSEQILDDKAGTLRVVMDLPGVDKDGIQISATDREIAVEASNDTRKYRAEQTLRAEVNPDTAKAEFKNGVLEVLFSLKDKSNKGARRVRVV